MKPRWIFMMSAGACLLLLLLITGILKPLGQGVRWLTHPLIEVSADASRNLRDFAGRSQASEAVLRELETRIASQTIDHARLRALEDENKTLRAQLKFLEDSGYEGVGAKVISRELQNGRMHFLLDRGTKDGVEVGQAVITSAGVFVGKILNARERVSMLEVFTDPDARTVIARSEGQRIVGVMEGRGNGAALLTYIPPSESLKKDDLLITAGTEEKVPGQLPVGIINRVNGKPTDPFLTAAVEPLVGLDRISFVSILRPRQ